MVEAHWSAIALNFLLLLGSLHSSRVAKQFTHSTIHKQVDDAYVYSEIIQNKVYVYFKINFTTSGLSAIIAPHPALYYYKLSRNESGPIEIVNAIDPSINARIFQDCQHYRQYSIRPLSEERSVCMPRLNRYNDDHCDCPKCPIMTLLRLLLSIILLIYSLILKFLLYLLSTIENLI